MNLITEGDEYYSKITRAINAAQSSILLEMYIVDNSAIAQKIWQAIKKASKRGIRVRVIIDSYGSYTLSSHTLEELRKAGVQLKVYMPPSLLSVSIHPVFRLLLRPAYRIRWYIYSLYRRNHRKLIVIDKDVVSLGGFNIMKENSRKISGHNRWLDLSMLTNNRNLARHARRIFLKTWVDLRNKQFRRLLKREKKQGEALNLDTLETSGIARSLKKKLRTAENRIWLMFPYFIPPGSWQRILKAKVARGVDVRIFLSVKSDSLIIDKISGSIARRLLRFGVKIYYYTGSNRQWPRFNHAKTAIIDNTGVIGTANLDSRSLYLNLEYMVYITARQGLPQLEEFFHNCQNQSIVAEKKDLPGHWWYRLAKPFQYFL